MNTLCIPLTIYFCSFFCPLSAVPVVNTKYGTVVGWTFTSRDGTPVDIYQGIPFAKPPVGKLRFEKPQPPDPWLDPLITQKYADGCVPCLAAMSDKSGNVSEDCLYLNVWTTSQEHTYENTSVQLPVMVFIHGGGFYQGQAFSFNVKSFADIYASQGIVVVTIQYRLAQFGFMTLNNTVLPANLGMWDQNLALRWVKENIENFNGDPTRITIWGESVGGMSVSAHTLSPHSRDLFQQSIATSGSIYGAISENKHTMNYTLQIIDELGCSNRTDVKRCLRKKSPSDFQTAAMVLNFCLGKDNNFAPLAPIQDRDFWPANYSSLVSQENAKPTMIGLNQKEGRFFSFNYFPTFTRPSFAVEVREWDNYNESSFRRFLNEFVTVNGYVNYSQLALAEIYDFFSRNKPENSTYDFWLDQFVEVVSDFMFVVPSIRELVAKTAAGYSTYAFLLDCFNRETWPADYPVQGSTHVGEFPYVFEQPSTFSYTEDDNAVKKTIQEGIIAFLRTGDPSTSSTGWDQFGSNMKYLSLKKYSEMKKGFFEESYSFWTKRMRKYDFDFITQGKWQ